METVVHRTLHKSLAILKLSKKSLVKHQEFILTLYFIMLENGQTYFKNFEKDFKRFLKYVCPFFNIMK